MLLEPFLGALVVLRRLNWAVLPALATVILVFMIREPLIVLARQRWVWRGQRPETAVARRYVLIELPLLALAGFALLWTAWPWQVLVVLGGCASALTGLAVLLTIRSRQRALWFQALSAAGLGSSGLAVCLAIAGGVPEWGWWLWGLLSAYFLAAILVVHARLEARIAMKKSSGALTPEFVAMRRQAAWIQAAMAAAGVALFVTGRPWYGTAMLLAAALHVRDLYTMHTPRALALPMTRVGIRAMVASIVFTALIIAGSMRGLL